MALEVKNPPANAGDTRDVGSILGLGRSPGGGNGTSLFSLGKFYRQRNLVGCSSWGHKELDTTEHTLDSRVIIYKALDN